MIRTPARLAVLTAATIAATLGPAALAQAKLKTCGPRHATTLAANGYARVYGSNGNAFVCIKSNGRTTLLRNASPSADHFALGGRWVGWSSSDPTDQSILPHSIVTVMRIPDHFVNSRWYPGMLNETVDKIVVISDGAAAWSMTPPAGDDSTYTIVQGTDRAGDPADQFSDDHTDLAGGSLHLVGGKTVGWRYTDGTTGTRTLF